MSPIPSVTTAFDALSTVAPSVAVDPDSAGQSGSVVHQHLLRAGGFVFAVVVLVSAASYFYHGRGAASNTRTSSTWTSFTSLLSSMRRRGPTTTSPEAATDWPADVEIGFEQHVNMVYAKFFHPTFWNVVEYHLGTPSAPAIYVEDEAVEIPATGSGPPGMSSFLNMDDDDKGPGEADGDTKLAREKLDRRALPPYDTSTSTDVNFSSQIIGATVRPGTFLSVPGEFEAPTEYSSSDAEVNLPYSPYDGIVTADSNSDFTCSSYEGIETPEPSPSSGTRRYGVADMTDFALTLEDTVPEAGYSLVPTISRRAGLLDLSNLVETDPVPSYGPMQRPRPGNHEWTISNCDVGVHDSREGSVYNSGDVDTSTILHDGPDLMRRLLVELRDPGLDHSPRPLSDDTDFEYSTDDDKDDDEEANVPRLTHPCAPHRARRNSLESTSALETDSDVSGDGPTYPITPPSKPTPSRVRILDVHKVPVSLPLRDKLDRQVVAIMSPAFSDSLPSLPIKAHVRSRRDRLPRL